MHRSGPRAAFLATMVAIALVLAACGSSSATPAPTAAPTSAPASSAPSPAASSAGGGDKVTIQDFAFSPATLEVAGGAVVDWTNQDSAGHTVTADDGSFDSKTLSSGQGFSVTFPTAGTFPYHCTIHTSMTGTITVKEPATRRRAG